MGNLKTFNLRLTRTAKTYSFASFLACGKTALEKSKQKSIKKF